MKDQRERAWDYVAQFEAHLDEGGTASPANARDLIATVRELCGVITNRDYDLYHLRQAVVVKCFQCAGEIPQSYDVYRCTDCSMPFHRECARLHFDGVPSKDTRARINQDDTRSRIDPATPALVAKDRP